MSDEGGADAPPRRGPLKARPTGSTPRHLAASWPRQIGRDQWKACPFHWGPAVPDGRAPDGEGAVVTQDATGIPSNDWTTHELILLNYSITALPWQWYQLINGISLRVVERGPKAIGQMAGGARSRVTATPLHAPDGEGAVVTQGSGKRGRAPRTPRLSRRRGRRRYAGRNTDARERGKDALKQLNNSRTDTTELLYNCPAVAVGSVKQWYQLISLRVVGRFSQGPA